MVSLYNETITSPPDSDRSDPCTVQELGHRRVADPPGEMPEERKQNGKDK